MRFLDDKNILNKNQYRPIVFWSWNNELDESELLRQIDEMYSVGIGGFIMHARTGLKTEYLGEKWFKCIEVCLKKAKELNMEAWVYDENGWPSGFVGGKLLKNEEYLANYLEYEVKEKFDEKAFAVFVCKENGEYERIKCGNNASEYHCIYLRTSKSTTDVLNPIVVDAFLECTHEEYYKRFKDSFGRELVGFFTDEPQYYRYETPYSKTLIQSFEERGENVLDGLIYLFVNSEFGYEYRNKYFCDLNRLYTNNFYKKVYEWCESHNCKLTGHSIEETGLFYQMWCCAGVMPSYEYEHIPAIDWLSRKCGTELSPLQIGSVSSQLGKKVVLSEMFACSGYDVTPKELRSIAEFQFFLGVNKICYHLYPYSVAGQGKYDHPPVFSRHNVWFNELSVFNDYFADLGYVIGETKQVCNVAVIHPMRGAYLDYTRKGDYESIRKIEDAFYSLIYKLRKHGISYQFIDETLFEKYGKIEGKSLRMGDCQYDTVIVPKMKTISLNTYCQLKKFKGNLCLIDNLDYIDGKKASVELKSTVLLDEIFASRELKFYCADELSYMVHRKGEVGEFIFIKNLSGEQESTVDLGGIEKEFAKIDFETGKKTVLNSKITIEPYGSVILIKDKLNAREETVFNTESLNDKFKVTDVTENCLILDYACVKKEQDEFSKNKPIQEIFDCLLREDYKGKIYIKQDFNLSEKMPLTLMVEKADYLYYKVNGFDVQFKKSKFDVNFEECELNESCLKVGKNEIEYCIDFYQHDGVHFALFDPNTSEALQNCIYYDTSIEPCYLLGDFIVNKDKCLARRRQEVFLKSMEKNGFPFYKGTVTVDGEYCFDGNGVVEILLDGRYGVANVFINGKEVSLVLDNKRDITEFLKVGKNDIRIKLKSGLRNFFGPHHFETDSDAMGVGPYHFVRRGEWQNGAPNRYCHDYISVKFGLDDILIIKKKG